MGATHPEQGWNERNPRAQMTCGYCGTAAAPQFVKEVWNDKKHGQVRVLYGFLPETAQVTTADGINGLEPYGSTQQTAEAGTPLVQHIRFNEERKFDKAVKWLEFCPSCYLSRHNIEAKELGRHCDGKYALISKNYVMNTAYANYEVGRKLKRFLNLLPFYIKSGQQKYYNMEQETYLLGSTQFRCKSSQSKYRNPYMDRIRQPRAQTAFGNNRKSIDTSQLRPDSKSFWPLWTKDRKWRQSSPQSLPIRQPLLVKNPFKSFKFTKRKTSRRSSSVVTEDVSISTIFTNLQPHLRRQPVLPSKSRHSVQNSVTLDNGMKNNDWFITGQNVFRTPSTTIRSKATNKHIESPDTITWEQSPSKIYGKKKRKFQRRFDFYVTRFSKDESA